MAKPDHAANPRILKLVELEQAGRIKPEHQQELDRYRSLGVIKAPKALTETQAKGGSFLTRAIGAEREYRNTGVGARSYVGQKMADYAPDILNSLPAEIGNSPERQGADSAQDEFIAASLRMDSGAAIPPPEMEKQRRIYFPMPGDGPDVIAQKSRARQRAIAGLRVTAGPAAGDSEANGVRLSPEKPKGGPGPMKIRGDQDYNRLPSGAEFIAPDGSRRRKP